MGRDAERCGMTSPESDNDWRPSAEPAPTERRHKLARKWAYLVSLTSYIPMAHADIEHELLELADRVFEAAVCEPLPMDRIATVGASLVDLHCVGKASLQCSMDVLAGALLAEPELRRFDRLPERVARVLGALASGYTEAIRSSTMEQQDKLHRALLEAVWTSERRLKIRQSWLDEVLACSATGIAIIDLDGRPVRHNPAFGRMLAEVTEETSLFDLVRPDPRGAYQNLRDGTAERLELWPELLGPNGKSTPVGLTAALLRDADGQPNGYVTIIA